jgi:AGCS family alanine or glycine:cation symporter
MSGLAHAQSDGIDQAISDAIGPIVNPIVSTVFYSVPVFGTNFPLIVGWLVVAAVVFTFYFGFIQFRGFKHSIELVRGDYFDPKDAGEVTPFQALATALSGTVGLGNIAGVGVAVYLGGPGATFWMILAGLLGMASKFTECILGVRYRNEYEDGTVSGGPMYYLSKGLSEDGKAALGKFLAVFFSICCIGGALGGGNMFQANQSFVQISSIIPFLEGKGWLFGLIMAFIVGIVIIGGIKSIARVTEKVVPGMAVIYVGAALIIIVINIGALPDAIAAIFTGAFAPAAVAGGAIGALIQGFKRAAFSNEAGIGSASIAHSAVVTKHPVTEGYVALLEPFIDTVVICTMTSLVITITGSWVPDSGVTGISLTSKASQLLRLRIRPGDRGGPVRLLDDDFLVLLRPQGLDLFVRRGQGQGAGLQGHLLRLRRDRCLDEPRPRDRFLRRDDLRHGHCQYHRPLHVDAQGQGAIGGLSRKAGKRRVQESQKAANSISAHEPDPARVPDRVSCPERGNNRGPA